LPERVSDAPARWDFSNARLVADEGLDNCFGGWAGQAQVYWPESDLGVRLQAGVGLDYLVVFTPSQPQGFIAVEPVSHLNNAINTAAPDEQGLLWLLPGETQVRELRLEVTSSR
jgi:aldose 1-epimerase